MFNIFGGGITGPGHINLGQSSQDRFYFLEEGENIFLAVADGAGSLSKSDIGAELAITTAMNSLRLSELSNLKEDLENSVLKASEVLKTQVDADELGCTLSVAVITPEEFGVSVMGDALGVVKDGKEFVTVRPPKHGEYANITKLLTSKEFEIDTLTGRTESLEFLALGSDGMDLSSISQDGSPFLGFWNKLYEWAGDPNFSVIDFLNFLNSSEKIDDDTTIVLAARSEG